jgi:hypothetical protein
MQNSDGAADNSRKQLKLSLSKALLLENIDAHNANADALTDLQACEFD